MTATQAFVYIGIGLTLGAIIGMIRGESKKQKIYNVSDIEEYDGLAVEIVNKKPVTGVVKSYRHFGGKLSGESTLVEGKFNGYAKSYYPSGKVKTITMITDNKKNGIHRKYYESGVIEKEQTFINDKIDGVEKEYDQLGFLTFTTVWKNNSLADSCVTQYYPSGQIYQETPYVNAKRNGIQRTYNSNGTLAEAVVYKDDEIYVA